MWQIFSFGGGWLSGLDNHIAVAVSATAFLWESYPGSGAKRAEY